VNTQIRRLAVGLLALYVALFAQLNNLQFFGADRLNQHEANTRPIIRDFDRPRGTITTIDGTVIARSTKLEPGQAFEYERRYPEGELYGHITGYISFNYGAAGLEDSYNDWLSGQEGALRYGDLDDLFAERDTTGDLVATIRADVQQVARDQLGGRPGSVVAIDPRSGAILAMYSNPGFDPNFLSATDLQVAAASWELLRDLPTNPMLPRAYRETYAPGSTFKVVTASAGVESGRVTQDSPVYPQATSYTPLLTDRPLRNFDGNTCGGTLFQILAVSCNSAFAEMGAEDLGPDVLVDGAESFGFNDAPPIDLPRPATSRMPTDYGDPIAPLSTYKPETTTSTAPPDPAAPTTLPPEEVWVYEDNPKLAQVSIGQNDVAATPLQMALVAAAIGNQGLIMRPHVMDHIRDRTGDTVERWEPSVWRQAVSPATAALLRAAMVGVVTDGTASRLAVPGFEVGGKTGTAQTGPTGEQAHAWIIGFGGPPGQPAEVAVAVIVEAQDGVSEQTGGRVAAPIAQAVLATALQPVAAPATGTPTTTVP
jgi:peptidoglycan glycosyltransferase